MTIAIKPNKINDRSIVPFFSSFKFKYEINFLSSFTMLYDLMFEFTHRLRHYHYRKKPMNHNAQLDDADYVGSIVTGKSKMGILRTIMSNNAESNNT